MSYKNTCKTRQKTRGKIDGKNTPKKYVKNNPF